MCVYVHGLKHQCVIKKNALQQVVVFVAAVAVAAVADADASNLSSLGACGRNCNSSKTANEPGETVTAI